MRSILSFAVIALLAAGNASAEGLYTQTTRSNSAMGWQDGTPPQQPQSFGSGQGMATFDGASGTVRSTVVLRSRFTGRLESFNQFVNPWTGAGYATATTYNPFTRQYESTHQVTPPQRQYDGGMILPPRVEGTKLPRPRPRIKVIEVEQEAAPAPPVESTPAGAPVVPALKAQPSPTGEEPAQ